MGNPADEIKETLPPSGSAYIVTIEKTLVLQLNPVSGGDLDTQAANAWNALPSSDKNIDSSGVVSVNPENP